jgi:hypothetical protein
MEYIMKISRIRTLVALAILGLFTQFSVAQDANQMGEVKEIADIVASINHFPSDSDKAALAVISGNIALPQGVRDMANTVSNIAHAANAEGKEAMARIQASDQAPDSAKSLAGMIANFNHMLSKEEKETLAQLFP